MGVVLTLTYKVTCWHKEKHKNIRQYYFGLAKRTVCVVKDHPSIQQHTHAIRHTILFQKFSSFILERGKKIKLT